MSESSSPGGPLVRLSQEDVIAGLNAALLAELQAAADYDAHAQASDDLSLRVPLETLRDVEQEHSTRLMARIRALGGKPVQPAIRPQRTADSPAGRLMLDLSSEQWAIVEYARVIAGAWDDEETVEMMTELLLDEMRHARWLKTTLLRLGGK